MKKNLFLLPAILFTGAAAFAQTGKCVSGNCRTGHGKMLYTDGSYYDGAWKGGAPADSGILYKKTFRADGTLTGATAAIGLMKGGQLTGPGTLIEFTQRGADMDTMIMWKGNFSNGHLAGSGKQYFPGIGTYYSDSWTDNYSFSGGKITYTISGVTEEGRLDGGAFDKKDVPVTTTTTTTTTVTTTQSSSTAPAPAATSGSSSGSMLDYGIFDTHQKKLPASYAPAATGSGSSSTSNGAKCTCCAGKGTIVVESFNHAMSSGVNYMKYENATCNCCHGTGRAADQTEWKAKKDGGVNTDWKH